jgi:hypothetical protein
MPSLSLGFNTTGLSSQGRTGPAILVSSVRSGAGSMGRVWAATPHKKRHMLYKNLATWLYGPGGSAPKRGFNF